MYQIELSGVLTKLPDAGVYINDQYIFPVWLDQKLAEGDTGVLAQFGITQVADPVYPDPALYTWAENVDGTITSTPIPQATIDANNAEAIKANISRLWAAAEAYESAQISGVAVGLLTIGVIQQKPISLSIAAWSASIWDLYYSRKAAMTPVWSDALGDFTSLGNIPHTIPELRAEVGM